jgi:hypothetical protein
MVAMIAVVAIFQIAGENNIIKNIYL